MKYWLLTTRTEFQYKADGPLHTNQLWKGTLVKFIQTYGENAPPHEGRTERDRWDIILFAQEITKEEYDSLYDQLS